MYNKICDFFLGKDPVSDLSFYSFWLGLCFSGCLSSFSQSSWGWLGVNAVLTLMAWYFCKLNAIRVRGMAK